MATALKANEKKLHVVLFPYLAHGHMIPMLSIAKLLASRNLKVTVLTTPLNAPLFSKSGFDVQLLRFPTAEAGLPEGCEHLNFLVSRNLGWDVFDRFTSATTLLQDPLEKFLTGATACPDVIVFDMFYPWVADSASKFGIPAVIFHGMSFFALCASISMEMNLYAKKKEDVIIDLSKPFVIPDLPDEIVMTAKQLPPFPFPSESTVKLFMSMRRAEMTSFGVLVNSYYELEPAYADLYRNLYRRRAWHIGPVSFQNSQRGTEEHECLKWLNSKKPNSVVYLSFGSAKNDFSASQMKEIAKGLESSGMDFVWVMKEDEEPLGDGFEERMKGNGMGMIVRGWAPQVEILEHEAVGGFVSHCGWNSTLEGIAAGVPMVTWPIGAEQFDNEKLVTNVLKIGVSVGVEEWKQVGIGKVSSIVKSETVKKAVKAIMEQGDEMRNKAKELAKLAEKAVEEGGSSYSDLSDLIDQLYKLKN